MTEPIKIVHPHRLPLSQTASCGLVILAIDIKFVTFRNSSKVKGIVVLSQPSSNGRRSFSVLEGQLVTEKASKYLTVHFLPNKYSTMVRLAVWAVRLPSARKYAAGSLKPLSAI
jgi:hypothetical protein